MVPLARKESEFVSIIFRRRSRRATTRTSGRCSRTTCIWSLGSSTRRTPGTSCCLETAAAGARDANDAHPAQHRLVVIVCHKRTERPRGELRAAWIQQLVVAERPAPEVVLLEDAFNNDEDSTVWANATRDVLGPHRTVHTVYTSEAYGDPYARLLGARHVSCDPARETQPISGTRVRAEPLANYKFLTVPAREFYVTRVVIAGAESTGKTTLARRLAAHLGCPWVPEVGREWTEMKAARAAGADAHALHKLDSNGDAFVEVAWDVGGLYGDCQAAMPAGERARQGIV